MRNVYLSVGQAVSSRHDSAPGVCWKRTIPLCLSLDLWPALVVETRIPDLDWWRGGNLGTVAGSSWVSVDGMYSDSAR